jgi:CPA1 family monovalent cation:H+ antiporter
MGVGGALVGAVLGAAFTLLTRQIDDHLIETALSLVLAYGSFLVAESLHCSGVLSCVFAGIVAGSYGAKLGMSPASRNAVEDFWELAAFVANSFIFLLVGLELRPAELWGEAGAVVVAFVAVALARALTVYTAIPIANRFAAPVPRAWKHAMVWGGLRGSLSMVLILTLPTSLATRSLLVGLVFGAVALSLFVQGLSMGPLLRRLGLLQGKQRHDDYERARATSIMSRRALDELEALHRDGLVEPEIAARLRRWSESRGEAADKRAQEVMGAAQISEQLAETVRRLAEAERRGIREAEHAAIVDVEIAEELDRAVALRLLLLEQAEGDPQELDAALEKVLVAGESGPSRP